VRREPVVLLGAAALLLSPVLFYAGALPGYLTNTLYASSGASAAVCVPGSCDYNPFDTWRALEVPLPAEPRVFRQWFDRICRPGSVLVVTQRATVFTDPPRQSVHRCGRS
jgi:hypothetical protein